MDRAESSEKDGRGSAVGTCVFLPAHHSRLLPVRGFSLTFPEELPLLHSRSTWPVPYPHPPPPPLWEALFLRPGQTQPPVFLVRVIGSGWTDGTQARQSEALSLNYTTSEDRATETEAGLVFWGCPPNKMSWERMAAVLHPQRRGLPERGASAEESRTWRWSAKVSWCCRSALAT